MDDRQRDAPPRDWLGHTAQAVAIIAGIALVQSYFTSYQLTARDRIAAVEGTTSVHTAAIQALQATEINTSRKLDAISEALTKALTRLDDIRARR